MMRDEKRPAPHGIGPRDAVIKRELERKRLKSLAAWLATLEALAKHGG